MSGHINEQLHKTDALTILSEGQSLESHKRMCMSQSFETPQQKYDRAKHSHNTSSRKHSPNFEHVHWNKEGLLEKLNNWPKDISINWSELAREFNIPGSNKCQVAKEFAIHNGLDVFSQDKTP